MEKINRMTLKTAHLRLRKFTLAAALATPTVFTFLCAQSAHAQKPFSIQDKWKIGGEGGWDYLLADPSVHRLYITHNKRVEVLDSVTGKPIGVITDLKGTHGVALDDSGRFGYISDGGANAVVVFDRSTLATVASIPVGTGPDGIVFEPMTKTVWAFNGRSHDVSVIDTAARKVVATIPLPGKPEFPQADGMGQVYDNIEDKNEIVRLDAHSFKVTATWPLDGLESPSGLAIDREGKRLFAVCDGKKMAVVDYTTGKVLAKPDIGNGPDAAGYDPKTKLAFSSNGEGTLSIVDTANGFKTIQTLPTQKGARTMAFDSSTGKVYAVAAQYAPLATAADTLPHPRPAVLPDTFTVLVIGR
jgi:YVTN family beta-propeller protein